MGKPKRIELTVEAGEVTEFVNPFKPGTSYADFVTAMGNKTVSEYCQDNLTTEQINWLETEIEHFKNKK